MLSPDPNTFARTRPVRRAGVASRCYLTGLLVAALAARATTAQADDVPREYAIKAAFLYNFTQFVEWPASAFHDDQSPFVIAVIGNDRFASVLESTLNGKNVLGRPFVVQSLAGVGSIGPCHMLFVAQTQDDVTPEILSKTDHAPVLTVGETDKFASSGGGIRFFTEVRKMRFELNMKTVTQAGLKVSGKLQKLARPHQD